MSQRPNKPLVPSNIEQLSRYIAGKTIAEVEEVYKPKRIAKLASNENRLGFSPKVKESIEEALSGAHNYPDPIARDLRKAIAIRNGVKETEVIIAAGSESIIAMLCRTFFLNKQNAITADATFVGFFVQIGVRGAHLKKVPVTKDFRFDVKAIVNAIDEDTKMVYIANPNNPTGTYITKEEYEWMMTKIPSDVLVVMDEAYYEFAERVEDYPHALDYGHENVIVLRTFSKAYGLAGFRVGYAIAREEIINYLLKTKLTFEPSALAQAAALAAYNDLEFLEKGLGVIEEGKHRLYAFFDKHNVEYVRSISNSVMMVFSTEEKAIVFTQSMLEKGVILRRINAFGLPKCVRISIGLKEDMDQFEWAYEEILDSKGK
tara:strand:- start:11212 stop:12333 length:1122 start_codon:yes stop_codon:yes gene_type:complete